jgi:S1-C subfamily serine protease
MEFVTLRRYKMKRTTLFFSLILVSALLVSGCSSALAINAVPQLASAVTAPTVTAVAPAPVSYTTASTNETLAALEGTLTTLYEQVNPSVVNIDVIIGSTQSSRMRQQLPQGGSEALGSGFVWDDQGHIVTNNHVVENATSISVTFADGTVADAKLVGADPNSDLAVIQVDVPADQLFPVTMTDSDLVKVGQLAIAIGNPYGLSGTMTAGIISALSRSLPVSLNDGLSGSTYTIPDIIQTDAAINPGNSGGVLVNDMGEVVGVTAAIESTTGSNSGIGFVIPANIVSQVVPNLIKDGKYEHPYMGITGVSLTREIAQAMNLNPDQKGVLVVEVTTNSPAEKAGLKGSTIDNTENGQGMPVGGDVIISIDGAPVEGFSDLSSFLYNQAGVGQTVNLTVLRDGSEKTLSITLGALPE